MRERYYLTQKASEIVEAASAVVSQLPQVEFSGRLSQKPTHASVIRVSVDMSRDEHVRINNLAGILKLSRGHILSQALEAFASGTFEDYKTTLALKLETMEGESRKLVHSVSY